MSKIIPGVGPIHPDLMIIGECPGETEEKEGIPFSPNGPSGRIITSALKENGIHRDEVYITNVVKVRPPYNNLNLLGVPIESFLPQLYNEINQINPKCILLVGNTALKYLTGLTGVLKYRGSIVEVLNKYKAVICRHPADFFPKEGERQFDFAGEIILRNFDVKRAIEESKSREIKLPLRNLWICKNSLELLRFLDRIPVESKLAIDIESHLAMPICLALSFNPLEALSVKLLNFKQKSTLDQTQVWKFLIEFFHDRKDIKIIGQNFKFDQSRCNEFGIQIPNPYSDTMLKAHTCYSHLPKGLAFLTSVWTREPYYKDEGKEFDIKKHGIDRLLLYNAKDAAVTLEVDNVLEKELVELGLHDFYYNYIMKRHGLYYDIDSVGFKVDEDERQNLISKYWNFYEEKFKRNRILLGHGFNPNSPKQCEEVFYTELKIPKRKDTKEETIQLLLGNVIKDDKRKEILLNTLDLRQARKTIGTYLLSKTDYDGRLRTSYNIVGTKNARTSTQLCKPPIRVTEKGWPFQNITKHSEVGKDIRKMIIADDGYVLLEMDKAQAEARLALLFAKDYDLLYRLEVLEHDFHAITASQVFGIPFDKISKKSFEREVGKHTSHACHNGMGKRRFVLHCAGFGITVSEKEADLFIFKYHRANPKIKCNFWRSVEECLRLDRKIINPFGRQSLFFGQLDDKTFKDAYGDIKQSTVQDSLIVALLLSEVWDNFDFNIVHEAHDSILALVPESDFIDIATILKREQNTPISFDYASVPLRRPSLIIPVDFKVGKRWSEMEDLDVPGDKPISPFNLAKIKREKGD